MSGPDVLTHLADTWSARSDGDVNTSVFGDVVAVAVHESGCELWCSDLSDHSRFDEEYYACLRQPVTSNGWEAHPTTADGVFETAADVEQFLNLRGDAIDRGVEQATAVAIIPHDSTEPFVDDDGTPLFEPSAVPTDDVLADVWTITPETSTVPPEALTANRTALVSYLYPAVSGSSDVLNTVSTQDMAYDDMQLAVYTVAPPHDLSPTQP